MIETTDLDTSLNQPIAVVFLRVPCLGSGGRRGESVNADGSQPRAAAWSGGAESGGCLYTSIYRGRLGRIEVE